MRVFHSGFWLVGLAIIAGLGVPERAQALPDDATELESVLRQFIDRQKEAQALRGGALILQGDIKLTPTPGGYAVSLPKMDIRSKTGDRVALGVIRLTAQPSPTIHGWDMDVTVPAKIQTLDDQGKVDGEITLATQSLKGQLNADLKEFTTLRVALGGIELRNRKDPGRARIESARFDLDLKPDAAGLWSGPGKGAVTGINFANPKERTAFSIAAFAFDSNCQECNSAAVRELALTALGAGWKPGGAAGAAVSGARDDALLAILRQCRFMSARYALTDANVTAPTMKGARDMRSFGVKTASFGGEVTTNPADSLVSGVLRYQIDSLTGLAELDTTGSPFLREFFPKDVAFEMTYRGVDPRRFSRASASASSNPPASAADSSGRSDRATDPSEGSGPPVSGLKEALLAPGSVYDLKRFSLSATAYDALLTGVLAGDEHVPLGLQLDMTLTCIGLDESLNRLRTMASNPRLYHVKEEDLARGIQTLTVLQLLGQQGRAEDGRSQRGYHFIVDEQGQVLLNGTDMKSLMDTMGGRHSKED